MSIKEIRNEMKMSQSQFADYLIIPVRTLQDWEQARRTPPEYVVKLLIEVIEARRREENFMRLIETETATSDEAKRVKRLYAYASALAELKKGEEM